MPLGGPCIVRGNPQLTEIDVADFMRAYYGAPEAPSGLVAASGDGRITWSWAKAADDPVIDHYEFRLAGRQWSRIIGSNADTISHQLVNLNNGITYTAEIRAVRGYVNGDANSVVSTPTAFVTPVITSLSAMDGRLIGTFTWAGGSPRMLTWELRRSATESGAYNHVAATNVLIALDLGQLIGLRLGHSEADVVSPDGGC